MSDTSLPNPSFVKKFDFRGVYGRDITDSNAYYLGHAINKTIPLRKVLIGWDTRQSSFSLANHFMRALHETGSEIFYLPKCPIDYVTAGANALPYDLSVMFTGSHNPWDWTGLLMHTRNGDSIQGQLVQDIIKNYYEVLKEEFTDELFLLDQATDATEEIEKLYAEKVSSLLPLQEIQPMSVLVDIGDGSGNKALHVLSRLLPQVTFTTINTREVYDASSSHTADPSEIKNMQDLMQKISSEQFDAGFAFDSDADRMLAVDEKGNYLNGSLLGSALSEALYQIGNSERSIGYAVDCGLSLPNTIRNFQKQDPSWKVQALPVGRSILRQMVRDGQVELAVENVGHFYLKDFFMTDSAVFSTAILLFWISKNGPLSMLSTKYPDGKREQKFVPVPDNQTEIITELEKSFQASYGEGLRKIEVDGLRFEMIKENTMVSWFATRKSGYEPIQKYFYGSLEEGEFEKLKTLITDILHAKS